LRRGKLLVEKFLQGHLEMPDPAVPIMARLRRVVLHRFRARKQGAEAQDLLVMIGPDGDRLRAIGLSNFSPVR